MGTFICINADWLALHGECFFWNFATVAGRLQIAYSYASRAWPKLIADATAYAAALVACAYGQERGAYSHDLPSLTPRLVGRPLFGSGVLEGQRGLFFWGLQDFMLESHR